MISHLGLAVTSPLESGQCKECGEEDSHTYWCAIGSSLKEGTRLRISHLGSDQIPRQEILDLITKVKEQIKMIQDEISDGSDPAMGTGGMLAYKDVLGKLELILRFN